MADWQEGASESLTKSLAAEDVEAFARLTGNQNPPHVDADAQFDTSPTQTMLAVGLIATVLGTKLPGSGATYAGQSLRFIAPVYLNDTITATVTLTKYDREHGRLTLSTVCTNQRGEQVITGEAQLTFQL